MCCSGFVFNNQFVRSKLSCGQEYRFHDNRNSQVLSLRVQWSFVMRGYDYYLQAFVQVFYSLRLAHRMLWKAGASRLTMSTYYECPMMMIRSCYLRLSQHEADILWGNRGFISLGEGNEGARWWIGYLVLFIPVDDVITIVLFVHLPPHDQRVAMNWARQLTPTEQWDQIMH